MSRPKLKSFRINRDWCKGCGICVRFCPRHCLVLDPEEKAAVSQPDQCSGCRMCQLRCPDLAIEIDTEPDTGSDELQGAQDEQTD
jgi:2-oxoglutarate ferredoxin oxidoreductase subunit delta